MSSELSPKRATDRIKNRLKKGLKVRSAQLSGGRERSCRLGKTVGGFELCVYFGPYYATGRKMWIGSGSKNADLISTVTDKFIDDDRSCRSRLSASPRRKLK